MAAEQRNGDRPTGKQIAKNVAEVFASLPEQVKTIYARADSGFYCWEAVQAYERFEALSSLRTIAHHHDGLQIVSGLSRCNHGP